MATDVDPTSGQRVLDAARECAMHTYIIIVRPMTSKEAFKYRKDLGAPIGVRQARLLSCSDGFDLAVLRSI
jgi:hypothetical protein